MSKIKLTQVCDITTGKLDANAAEENGRYPYFTCAPEPLTINSYAFDEDAILLAGNNAAGNFHCQRYNGKFNAYQRTYVITARDGYDIEYIFYCLKINLELLRKKAQGSQTKFLTMQLLDAFEIDDIPLAEQKRIAYTLSDIDNKIENNNKINAELESMAKTIYDYWFLQFEFPNEDGKPYKSSGGKMVWNEELKREIPEGWEVVQIGKILDKYPKTESVLRDDYEKGILFPIIDQSKDFICGYTDDKDKVLHLKDAIVFGDHTNFAKYINFDFARGADGTQIIVSKNKNLPNYLLYLQIVSLPVIEQGYSRHFKFLKEQFVFVPNKIVSEKYMKIIEDALLLIKKNIFENRELSLLRDFLLPMLMNGQVGFKINNRKE